MLKSEEITSFLSFIVVKNVDCFKYAYIFTFSCIQTFLGLVN